MTAKTYSPTFSPISTILISEARDGKRPLPTLGVVSSVSNFEIHCTCKDASTAERYKGLRSFDERIDTVNRRKATNHLLDL